MPNVRNTSDILRETLQDLVTTQGAVRLPGWHLFNTVTGGLRPREFTILCGSTGSGKTTWLANLSVELLRAGVKHFVMNVETGPHDFMRRVLSVLERTDLNTGDPIDNELALQIADRHADVLLRESIRFSTAEDRTKHTDVIEDLKRVAHEGCKVAFIDNLNFLLDVVSAHNQVAEMDRVVHELIMLTKQIDLHVVMVMHPRKTDGGRVESEFDIKGSSTAVQEAHNVFLFNRPRPESTVYLPYNRELKIAKLRRRGRYVGSEIVYSCAATNYSEVKIQ